MATGQLKACLAASLAAVAAAASFAGASTFVNFETFPGQPIALSRDGSRIFAVNMPDGRLAVLDAVTLARLAEIPVGLEPTSVAERPGTDEVWVVDNLSDGVSIVSLGAGHVVDSFRVGDEPVEIAFTPGGDKAYVTVSAEDRVAVIDAVARSVVRSVPVPGDPRALSLSPDGSTLYVAPYESGNQTRVLHLSPGSSQILFDPTLPDVDLVAIRTSDDTIVAVAEHLGTLMTAVRAGSDGRLVYATSMNANNLILGQDALRGVAIDNRLAVLDAASLSLVRQIDLDGPAPSPATANAEPADVAFGPGGAPVYVASAGSGVVQVLDPSGTRLARIPVGVGPARLAMSATGARLYLWNRLRHEILAIDTAGNVVVSGATLGHDPTPALIRRGRSILYNANLSGTGKFACGGCHAGGHLDNLAWDLGTAADPKGPMFTQSLRGLRDLSPYHWRGDRPSLESFNVAFEHLMGGSALTEGRMRVFARFLESIAYPPNPEEALDRSLGPAAQRGLDAFRLPGTTGGGSCVGCHALQTTTGEPAFGTNRQVLADPGDARRGMKVPQLRGLADKVAFTHDGSSRSLLEFLQLPFFQALTPAQREDLVAYLRQFESETMPSTGARRALHAGTCGDPDTLAAIVLLMDRAGREVRPGAGRAEIEVEATGPIGAAPAAGGRVASLLYRPGLSPPAYEADASGLGPFAFEDLRAMACDGDAVLVFTAIPAGTGERTLDRDGDGLKSGDEEVVHGTDPGDADSDDDGLGDRREVFETGTDALAADSDGDGVGDAVEIDDGTDPLDAASRIVLVDVDEDRTASSVTITWTTREGTRYLVEKADAATDAAGRRLTWATIYTSSPETESPGGTESYTDASAAAVGAARLFRVRVAP